MKFNFFKKDLAKTIGSIKIEHQNKKIFEIEQKTYPILKIVLRALKNPK